MFWRAIYKDGVVINETDNLVKFNELKWEDVHLFGWVPERQNYTTMGDAIPAVYIHRQNGFRVFARRQGFASVRYETSTDVYAQTYGYHLGLFKDDGSSYVSDVERGIASTVENIQWDDGVHVIIFPDGSTYAMGEYLIKNENIEGIPSLVFFKSSKQEVI